MCIWWRLVLQNIIIFWVGKKKWASIASLDQVAVFLTSDACSTIRFCGVRFQFMEESCNLLYKYFVIIMLDHRCRRGWSRTISFQTLRITQTQENKTVCKRLLSLLLILIIVNYMVRAYKQEEYMKNDVLISNVKDRKMRFSWEI